MRALTFQEIRDIVHDICKQVDTEYDSDCDVYDAICESCSQYFIYHTDVWSVAMGMRFEYHEAWFEAEEAMAGSTANWIADEYLYAIVHECLRLLVDDAHANKDHL